MFLIWYEHDLSVCDAPQVLAVPVLVGELLHDRDRQALRPLDRAHELARLEQAVHRARVQPRVATPQCAHVQTPLV